MKKHRWHRVYDDPRYINAGEFVCDGNCDLEKKIYPGGGAAYRRRGEEVWPPRVKGETVPLCVEGDHA
ncbi:MAG: hypothetical protein AABY46_02405 [Nitrospirota bacterium]